jgi:hypothetical protein
MASFIIPLGILGLSSPRTIYMDNGVTVSKTAVKTKMKFGDGYKQIVHRSPTKSQATVTFNNREPEEINLIESYFIYLSGSPIDDLTILDENWDGIVKSFSKSYNNGALYGLSATIEEQ